MAEAAAQERRAAHLPEQPRQAFGASGAVRRQERAELLGQVQQDRAGFEHPHRRRAAMVHQHRDLGIRVGRDEAAAELVAVVDPDQPGVVLRRAMAERQEFLQHRRHLDAVGRGQRVQLQGMAADRQVLVVRRARRRAVDAREAAAGGGLPGPDVRRGVGRQIVHRSVSSAATRATPAPSRRIRIGPVASKGSRLTVAAPWRKALAAPARPPHRPVGNRRHPSPRKPAPSRRPGPARVRAVLRRRDRCAPGTGCTGCGRIRIGRACRACARRVTARGPATGPGPGNALTRPAAPGCARPCAPPSRG